MQCGESKDRNRGIKSVPPYDAPGRNDAVHHEITATDVDSDGELSNTAPRGRSSQFAELMSKGLSNRMVMNGRGGATGVSFRLLPTGSL